MNRRPTARVTGRAARFNANEESGAVLVLALFVLAIIGVVAGAYLGLGETSIRATAGFRNDRARQYSVDGALDGAINWVARNPGGPDPANPTAQLPGLGRDVSAVDPLNPDPACTWTQPASVDAQGVKTPALTVSCAAVPTDLSNPSDIPSGQPHETGKAPDNAVLTLGQKQNQPGPLNPLDQVGSRCQQSDLSEVGIRAATHPVASYDLFNAFAGCPANSAGPLSDWRVNGNIFANSPIDLASGTLNASGTVKARGGCRSSAVVATGGNCQTLTYTATDATGDDPGSRVGYEPRIDPTKPEWKDASGVAIPGTGHLDWSSTPDPDPTPTSCTAANPIKKYSPGVYTDVAKLNLAFKDSTCAGFWFKPGVYYFNFNETGPGSSKCNNGGLTPASNLTRNEWCIGDTGSAPAVLGGTQYGWDPDPDPSGGTVPTSGVKVVPAGRLPSCTFFIFGCENGYGGNLAWTNAAGALTKGDSSVASYNDYFGGGISVTGFSVPSGPIARDPVAPNDPTKPLNRINVLVYAATTKGNEVSGPPTVIVRYSGGSCGPYTANADPTTGAQLAWPASAPTDLTQARGLTFVDQKALHDCLSSGDKINTAFVAYNVKGWSSFNFFGTPPVARVDAIQLAVPLVNVLRGPGPVSETDFGGDCDPTKPGVQFIFGGESHVTIANGSMELCAGPDSDTRTRANSQQIAIYQVPAGGDPGAPTYSAVSGSGVASHRMFSTTDLASNPSLASDSTLRPRSRSGATVAFPSGDPFPLATTGSDRSYRIGDPQASSAAVTAGASIAYPSCSGGGCPALRTVTFSSFPDLQVPASFTVDGVGLRIAHDDSSTNSEATRRLTIRGSTPSSWSCTPNDQPQFNSSGMKITTLDVKSCFDPQSGITTQQKLNDFSVDYVVGSNDDCFFFSGCRDAGTAKTDGIDVTVRVKPTTSSVQQLNPASGCTTTTNYWNGWGTGWGSNSVVPANQVEYGDGSFLQGFVGISEGSPIAPGGLFNGGIDQGSASPDCAVVRVSAHNQPSSSYTGRLSVKGTVYAPSGVVDVDDRSNCYPVFTRGLIARHFRLRNFAYSTAQPGCANQTLASNQTDTTPYARKVLFFVCAKASGTCNNTDPTLQARAQATFDYIPAPTTTSKPSSRSIVVNWIHDA